MPKISVIMTVYNTEEKYLREAVESVLNQTFGDFEFIIIDDGSTNNAVEVVKSYRDERIKLVLNGKNLGMAKSSNIGLEMAQGEYIARMDSDDISLPERFEKQIEYMEKHQDIDILSSYVEFFPEKRKVYYPLDDTNIKLILLFVSSLVPHTSAFFRAAVLKDKDLKYDESYAAAIDYAFFMAAFDKAKFANMKDVLVKYRWHISNVSNSKKQVQIDADTRIKDFYQKKFLGEKYPAETEILKKIRHRQKITSDELLCLADFVEILVSKVVDEENKEKVIKSLAGLYKLAAKKYTKRDLKFFKILWTHPVSKYIQTGNLFFFKLRTSFIWL